jgi:hypothetical protein
MTQLAEQAASDAQTRGHVPALVERLGRKYGLDSSQREELGRRLESEVVRREIDARIGQFHDRNPDVGQVIEHAAAEFSRNPRELKRFVNAFRFHYFLLAARESQNEDAGLSLDQIGCWGATEQL